MRMEKMGAPSQEEQSKIQGERALSDLELVKGGAEFKEAGRMEATGEQVEAAKKEMEAEKKSESPEIKSLEELKTRAQEAGASPEDIKVLENKLEQARDGGESYIAKKEEYNLARERELVQSMEKGGAFRKKAEGRKVRDAIIGGSMLIGSLGVAGAGLALGGVLGGPFGVAAMSGLMVGGLPMMASPIARIQNWFEKRKLKKELIDVAPESRKEYYERKI